MAKKRGLQQIPVFAHIQVRLQSKQTQDSKQRKSKLKLHNKTTSPQLS